MAISTAHAQISKILQMEKEAFWLENVSLLPSEIQQRWATKCASLSAIVGGSAPTHPVDLGSALEECQAPQQGSHNTPIPRRMPSASRPSSDNVARHNILPMVDQTPGSSQSKSKKRPSHSQSGAFMNTGAAVPPLALHTWELDNEEPFSSLTASSTSSRPAKTRKTAFGCQAIQIPESEIREYEVADYVQVSQSTLSPAFSPSTRSRRNSNQNGSPSSYLSQSPATRSDGFTNPTSISMSRNDSLGGSSMYEAMKMLKVNSQTSQPSQSISNTDNKVENSPQTFNPALSSMSNPVPDICPFDFSLSVSHAGGMVDDTNSSVFPFTSDSLKLPLVVEEDLAMSRTVSSESRISRRSQEQAVLSTRPIAPKAEGVESMSRQSSSSSASSCEMARERSADGLKVSIPKTKYQRPTHEKVKCTMCKIKPNGFRGPHELRRHIENKHSSTRRVWVCKDRSPDQMFLSKCKHCNENKKYGAYYNAAAHLRRIHWDPKEKGKKSNKSAKSRGGIGGGDHPSMDVLKLWIEGIDQPVTENMPALDDEEEEKDDGVALDEIPIQEGTTTPPDFSPSGNAADYNIAELQHHDYALLAHNSAFSQFDYLTSSDDSPIFVSPSREDTFDIFGSPPTFNNNTSDAYASHAAEDLPSSAPPEPSPPNTNALNFSPVNHNLATGIVDLPADLLFTSSMNSPVDHLDPFNTFEPSFFDLA